MKIEFTTRNRPNKNTLKYIDTINGILDGYLLKGFVLSLRQLYYQLVSRDVIQNSLKQYTKLSRVCTSGRLSGLIDWDAIEDRIRIAKRPYWATGVTAALNNTISQYRLNRQKGQPRHIEVWIEKDALSNIFLPITSHYHIYLLVNRGYASISAMYEAAKRMKGKDPVILYFGDHDPSGLDMIRDIRERLEVFDIYAEVIPVALTLEQIQQYNPPPNPAKLTDPRAKEYIKQFGRESWELDALSPEVLQKLVQDQITGYLDSELFDQVLKQEKKDIQKLKTIISDE